MGYNLRNRSLVKLLDFIPTELRFLLKLSADLKAASGAGSARSPRPSTRSPPASPPALPTSRSATASWAES